MQTATMEGTGVYWEQPYHVLEAVGSRAHVVHAQHARQMKGRKTDGADGLWLARICQFSLARDSFVPSPELSALQQLCRMRRKLVGDLTRPKQRIHKSAGPPDPVHLDFALLPTHESQPSTKSGPLQARLDRSMWTTQV